MTATVVFVFCLNEQEGKNVRQLGQTALLRSFSAIELAWGESYLNKDIVQEKLLQRGDIRAC